MTQTDHKWPAPGECLWTPWYSDQPQRGIKPATQYRSCLHPACSKVERRVAPRAS